MNSAVDPTDSTPATVATRRKKCNGPRLPSCGRITAITQTPSVAHMTASPIDSTMASSTLILPVQPASAASAVRA